MKILPELMKSVEFGGGGPKALGLVLKIAKSIPNEDFDAKITPFIIRLFSNPDRALRVCLLDNLPLMIDRLPQKIVNDKIFPQLVNTHPYYCFMQFQHANYPLGDRFHRLGTSCTRANTQIGSCGRSEAIGSGSQRRAASLSSQNCQ
jgi:hypothetical protein